MMQGSSSLSPPCLSDVLLQTCLEWNTVKIERKKNDIKAGARNEKKRYQRFGRTKRKPAQKEMKKIGQRIKQGQKRKSVGRSNLINFLKRGPKKIKKKGFREMK